VASQLSIDTKFIDMDMRPSSLFIAQWRFMLLPFPYPVPRTTMSLAFLSSTLLLASAL